MGQVAAAARFETWPVGHPGVDGTGVCVPFPTKESLLRNAGETRGLIVMMAQAIARGQCLFSEPDSMRKPVAIEGDDVDSLAPMLVWWKSQGINKEYSDSRKTFPAWSCSKQMRSTFSR